VKSDVLVACLDEVKNDVAAVLAEAFPIAEPAATVLGSAAYYTVRLVDAAVGACVWR